MPHEVRELRRGSSPAREDGLLGAQQEHGRQVLRERRSRSLARREEQEDLDHRAPRAPRVLGVGGQVAGVLHDGRAAAEPRGGGAGDDGEHERGQQSREHALAQVGAGPPEYAFLPTAGLRRLRALGGGPSVRRRRGPPAAQRVQGAHAASRRRVILQGRQEKAANIFRKLPFEAVEQRLSETLGDTILKISSPF